MEETKIQRLMPERFPDQRISGRENEEGTALPADKAAGSGPCLQQVAAPGVYELAEGSRIYEAVKRWR